MASVKDLTGQRLGKLGVYLEDDNSIERLDIFEINSWIKTGNNNE